MKTVSIGEIEVSNTNLFALIAGPCQPESLDYARMLVSGFGSLPIMAETSYPDVCDATHSVQVLEGLGASSGGQRQFVEPPARAVLVVGAGAGLNESHEDPDNAPSDGPNMVFIDNMGRLLGGLRAIDDLTKAAAYG